MPISIVTAGWVFNVFNSSLNATAITWLPNYFHNWLVDLRFPVGTAIFFCGLAINLYSDHILRSLRRVGEKAYKVPYGGLFRWVTSPNYLGEITEWIGWAIASWSLAGVAFAIFTFANLAPRARAHHRWYLKHFPHYPKNRKALIPKIF
jgi:protein-S-isoprenylcysteine O-methyltransferase Ste14